MFANVTIYQIQPGWIEQRLRHSRDVTGASGHAPTGYKSKYVLVNRESHKTMTISLWETRAAIQDAQNDEGHRQSSSRSHFAVGDGPQEVFEVATTATMQDGAEALPTGQFATVRTWTVLPGKMDERLHHSQEVSLAAIRKVPGWRGSLVLVNRASHKNVTLTLWGSKAERAAFERHDAASVQAYQQFAAGPITMEHFEVGDTA